MDQGDISLACAAALIDGLVAAGASEACLSPGSRSTPLALALARDPRVRVHVHLDERSSAFFALGLSKASGAPAIVATTSGTAVAELLPAVVEASQTRIPLVLLTADRPPRVRGTGANQTIVQPGLFAGYARASFDLPLPAAAGQEAWWRQAAREAFESLTGDPPGPVHLNCPFEEPLTPSAEAVTPAPTDETFEPPTRPEAELDPSEVERLVETVSGRRGAIVLGGWPGDPWWERLRLGDLRTEAAFWSEVVGWPVLAEPTSGARVPGSALGAGQALLASGWLPGHVPEAVIQFGAHPTSRATDDLLAAADRLIVADRWHLDPDPDRRASWRLAVDPDAIRRTLVANPFGDADISLASGREGDRLRPGVEPAPAAWRETWRRADARASSVLEGFLLEADEPFEPRVACDVAAWVPDGGTLVVGNSTPVRDLDLAMAPREGLRVLANRGASGIDGLVSTSLGIAAGGPGPTVALLGDLSFVHDAGATLWNASRGIDLTVVVVNNGGGHVFSLLPQRELPEHRDLFVTPHGLDLEALCRAAGAGHERIERARDLIPALDRAAGAGGLRVVEVVVDADLGLRRRRELRDEIDRALAT